MGRRRKAGNEWLPERVYVGRSAYEYKPGDGRTIKLLPLGASQRAVLRAYDEAKRKEEQRGGSVAELVDEYLSSARFQELASSSQDNYKRYAKTIVKVFGRMAATSVRPAHVRQFMDARGKTSKSSANMEHQFLGVVYSWAFERGKVTINPTKGVKRWPAARRNRYITDEEYQAIYSIADPLIQAVMEISYCCAARVGDVLNLQREQLREDGIFIRQGKTGKEQIKRWTPRLRRAIALAESVQVARSATRVVADKKGQRIPAKTFDWQWRRLKKQAAQQFPGLRFDFTFHDIKAKSISDYEGDKQKFSGHRSARMVQVYDRKTDIVDSHD